MQFYTKLEKFNVFIAMWTTDDPRYNRFIRRRVAPLVRIRLFYYAIKFKIIEI